METAITVVAYAFSVALVIGAVAFALLCWTLRDRTKEMDRKRAEADAVFKRVEEKIERGSRLKGGRL